MATYSIAMFEPSRAKIDGTIHAGMLQRDVNIILKAKEIDMTECGYITASILQKFNIPGKIIYVSERVMKQFVFSCRVIRAQLITI